MSLTNNNNNIVAFLLSFGVLFSSFAVAQTAEEKGLAIFEEAERREQGFVDNQADMTMVIKRGDEVSSTREMRVKWLEGTKNKGDKSLMVFVSPPDQRGTALLTHKNEEQDDDQWLYLPALKRVKKIASSKKSGSFMGSEFSFEDIGGQSVSDYTYRFIEDGKVEGQPVWVVESYPKDKHSGYTKIVNYIGKAHYRTLMAEFYDRKSSHLKTMVPQDFHQYQERFWRPSLVTMTNHQTNHSTVLKQNNIEFKTGLSELDFNKNSLKRAR